MSSRRTRAAGNLPLAAAVLALALGGCTTSGGDEAATTAAEGAAGTPPAHDAAGPGELPGLALALVDGSETLPDLPERLTAGAEMTSIDTVTCEADLALTAPVTTCTGGDPASVHIAYLVRSGEDGSDLAVLLTAAELSEELTTEVTDPEVSVHYAAEDRLFTTDPARLDPETLRLRAEMAVADMGLTESVQGCRTEDGATVTCTAVREGGEGTPSQITLYPAVSTSGDQVTVGLLRDA